MQPRVDVITLAVEDLDRALRFYRELGLVSEGIVGTEFAGDDKQAAGPVVMFELRGGLLLALYPRSELAKDANVPLSALSTGGFSIAQFVASRDEVDGVLVSAQAAGATITDRGHERPWGIYSGYFRDLDGHLWEIIFNPNG